MKGSNVQPIKQGFNFNEEYLSELASKQKEIDFKSKRITELSNEVTTKNSFLAAKNQEIARLVEMIVRLRKAPLLEREAEVVLADNRTLREGIFSYSSAALILGPGM